MFINFEYYKKHAPKQYSNETIRKALQAIETKNPLKIEEIVKDLNESVTLEEALSLFTNKIEAIKALSLYEAEAKPGPDPYMRDLDDEEKEDKEEQMKDQAEMDDDDPDAYKEMPGDEEAREKGEVKTSKHTKAYDELYGDDEVDEARDMNDPVLIAFRAAQQRRQELGAQPVRRSLTGKSREKAEDKLWNISQELKDLYSERGDLYNDMENEAGSMGADEFEAQGLHNEYGDKLNKVEAKIEKLLAQRSKLEVRLAESFEVNEAIKGSVKKVTSALRKQYKDQGLDFIAKVYQDAMEDANFHNELDSARGIGVPSRWKKDVYYVASNIASAAAWNGYFIAQGTLAFLKEIGEDAAAIKFGNYLEQYDLLEAKMPVTEAVDAETVVQIELEDGIYYIKPYGDSTHFYMSTMKDGIENAIPAHIGQHRNRPYYSDLRKYLKGGKDIDGNSYIGEGVFNDKDTEDYQKGLEVAKKYGIPVAVAMATAAAMGISAAVVLFKKGARAVAKWIKGNTNAIPENLKTDIRLWESYILEEDINEGKDDYMARYGKTDIMIKKGYKVADEGDLEDLYVKLGELAAELGFGVKNITVVTEGKTTWQDVMEHIESIGEDEQIDEMTYGQLERCVDYAKMIRDRYDKGYSFDSWMHSKVNCAKKDLNAVFDALDGGDGEIEESVVNEDLKGEIKKYIKKNQKNLDALADADEWDQIYNQLYVDFDVEPDSSDAQELKTVFTVTY